MSARAHAMAWGGLAVLLALAPWVWGSSLSLSILSQIGIAAIACLSYNILFGQGGMLSFGHAVYTGLGAYVAVHALNAWGGTVLPVSLVPLVGGLGGMFFALLFGWVTTRRSGTTLAMITLGLGELVFALSLMLPEFFGGEGGISTNRVVGHAVLGISFGPARQVYALIAVYTFASVAAMYGFTRTPLGRMLNAVRDNPQRAAFVGYDTHRVRYLAFVIAGFFAGISGGLAVLNFEIVTAEVVGLQRSAGYLLFTFIGGAGHFAGPLIGAVLMVLANVLLSELTRAWLLYLGLAFVLMVMYAPGGIASLVVSGVRAGAAGRWRGLVLPGLSLFAAGLLALVGVSAMVEMAYTLQLDAEQAAAVHFVGTTLDAHRPVSWMGALVLAVVGLALLELARRRIVARLERGEA